MILTTAYNVYCNNVKDPLMLVNGVQVWPMDFSSYTILFTWSPAKQENICLDGLGWGDSLSYIHSENVNWADYYDGSTYEELTTAEIVHACENDGTATQKYCYEMGFNLKGSDMGRFTELTFKTGEFYQPAGTLKVTIIGYGTSTVQLASKTVSMAANTTYHIYAGEFDT